MCDSCGDLSALLSLHDDRMQDGLGLHLSKTEILVVISYGLNWQQRQCLCCFKDYKNLERFNNIVQVIMNHAIKLIYNLPDDMGKESEPHIDVVTNEKHDQEPVEEPSPKAANKASSAKEPSDITVDTAGHSTDKNNDSSDDTEQQSTEADAETADAAACDKSVDQTDKCNESNTDSEESWTVEEKDSLFLLVTKVFLMNFPLYVAHKHSVHQTLDEMSQQEANVLNTYCDISNTDIPVYLLRNVCFFCDSNGLQSIAVCFDKADTKVLPYTVAHTLINVIANLRLWMNINTVMNLIVPIRSHVIRYMCRLSDQDLRLAGLRNMTDLMMTSVKDPIESPLSFDQEILDLAFKYFTCTTLTIRISGITQINNQVGLYNELTQTNDNLAAEAENIGTQLATWLSKIKMIEHIFGPNLHMELIKQSQLILNFLALEARITNEHIDCIWAASLTKHCSRPVHDILIPLIKNLEVRPAQHLLSLVSSLDPAAHTEQTLYLSSELLKFLWCTAITAQTRLYEQNRGIYHNGEQTGIEEEDLDSSDELLEAHMHANHKNTANLAQKQHLASLMKSCEGHKAPALPTTLPTTLPTSELDQSDSDAECSESSEDDQEVHRHLASITRKRDMCADHELYDESEEEEGCIKHIKVIAEDHDTSEYSSDDDESAHYCDISTEHSHNGHSYTGRHRLHHAHQHTEDTDMSCDDLSHDQSCVCMHSHSTDDSIHEHQHCKLHNSTTGIETSEEAAIIQELENSSFEADEEFAALTHRQKLCYLHSLHRKLRTSDSSYVQRMHRNASTPIQDRELMEEILSPDDDSCNSSHLSNKSEKNMADFEGEDGISDEELSHINPTTPQSYQHHHVEHLQPYSDIFYHSTQENQGTSKKSFNKSDHISASYRWDEVCLEGNTVLWDLVQDDKSCRLADGIAQEAEKVLCSLLCLAADRRIRTKFIEACINNISNNRSVVVSLRLLPKLFNSFQQLRTGLHTHSITMWAERELSMLKHFFTNLVFYATTRQLDLNPPNALYSHKEQVQVRLYFLTCIFSNLGSPCEFKLNRIQADTLWSCLAMDSECSGDCLSWFLQQAKSKEHHAMSDDTLQYLFNEKVPKLDAEQMSMVGLNLFMQLMNLAKQNSDQLDSHDDQVSGMNQLWKVALRAQNTDVSLTAIQYLNTHYIQCGVTDLVKEQEFIEQCMEGLVQASEELEQSPDTNLLMLQRGLILLTSHLEDFRKRYAFHLRNWRLIGCGINSHQKSLADKNSSLIRITLQPGGSSEKTIKEMYTTDLVSELRAEVTQWWGDLKKQAEQSEVACTSQQSTPILGAMLGDGPIRMITHGQELTADVDEKTLGEMQIKDLQLVFVSLGASRSGRKHEYTSQHNVQLVEADRQRLPMVLLLQDQHFSKLFALLHQLSNFTWDSQDMDDQVVSNLQMKARMLSRKVWELVMLLPTNPDILDGFKNINSKSGAGSSDDNVDWDKLLHPHSTHRLMYSLQIVESLSKPPRHRLTSMFASSTSHLPSTDSDVSVEGLDLPEEVWSKHFIERGGLKHLFNVFLSGSLQTKDSGQWNEWKQDCLAYLLRLLSQFAVTQSDNEEPGEEVFDENPRKKMKYMKSQEKIIIPTLNKVVLSLSQVELVTKILVTILFDAALPNSGSSVLYQSGCWGRVEVVHYALSFFVSLAHSYPQVHNVLCKDQTFPQWLKRLTLEAPEPLVRKEACHGLYRLCMGQTIDGKSGYNFLSPMLDGMLEFFDDAQKVKPINKRWNMAEEKETYGPSCRDYYWLVCRLVENITAEDAQASWVQNVSPDLDSLAHRLSDAICERGFLEKRINTEEDYSLIGMLQLFTAVSKHKPPFCASEEGRTFLKEAFQLLFALPSPEHRFYPKAKTPDSRSAVYDTMIEMVRGNAANYRLLHAMVAKQHVKESHSQYSWDNWPHEEGRSNCGYVGLTNLGATCYMATCMQHLYMIPEARKSVLEAQNIYSNRHEGTLYELKKMFAYLLESERKAYNPRSFCKVYTMDKQPLNTCEQKDMTEFFTDLISKLEEMGPELKELVKTLFGGVLTNNVVSLDCPHVSRTKEEFYTVRCQVADMKNLYESLDEVTVKDMLEGDNMYTCSRCQKKVRAEKRACFKILPKILCFNTMRYTFNMLTMMKEKVNTHFSFPLRLDMSGYMEENLISTDKLSSDDLTGDDDFTATGNYSTENENCSNYVYQLIGVTVHTGTADGGHYYSFIRDRLSQNARGQDKWFLFNDAEVKQFDPQQLASECFGGEMTSKTYDSVTDKFMDFSFEKTHSAYMLFYERLDKPLNDNDLLDNAETHHADLPSADYLQGGFPDVEPETEEEQPRLELKIDLTKELLDMIWQDNMQFLQDKNIFEQTYFWFMWQMCSYLHNTLDTDSDSDGEESVALLAAKLTASFVLETLIHAKEKPTMLQWIELLTKQFNSCQPACEWFLDFMAEDDWWPQQNLIKCPLQVVRQMFQRLLIHVISQLRTQHSPLYLDPLGDSDEELPVTVMGSSSCVTRFVKKMLSIIECDQKPNTKYLSEYFTFLYDFARMGEEECLFLIQTNAIHTMVSFYTGHKLQENYVEILSDDDDDDDDDDLLPVNSDDRYRPQALEKMISLIAVLVEKSRGDDKQLHLSQKDMMAIIGGKNYPFLMNQIRDNINLKQTANLIISLCRWNDRLASSIVQMVFGAIARMGTESQSFFKLLSLLVEFIGGPPGIPLFTSFILRKLWEVFDLCPQQCLEWLSMQVGRNKIIHEYTLDRLQYWVEIYLMAHSNARVRNASAMLLVSLVPSNSFKQTFRMSRSMLSPHKDIGITSEALRILHIIYEFLLKLLQSAHKYIDPQPHGTNKLVPYFGLLTYCLISREQKLMFSEYFLDMWHLFQPRLAEPAIATHQNKQALLLFWHQVCVDCTENIRLVVTNTHVVKHIAFNYIFVDNEDQDLVLFNRCMLPAYYGLLRMCCAQSRSFTRQLASHQNIQWAFRFITPFPAQYSVAVDELFRMMRLMVHVFDDSKEEELKAISQFRKMTIQMYMQHIDSRMSWQTVIMALKILVDSPEDRIVIVTHDGLSKLQEAFNTLHVMYHEATACHVTGDLSDLMDIITHVIQVTRTQLQERKVAVEIRTHLNNWKDKMDFVKKLLTLLNSYTPPEVRVNALNVLRELVLLFQSECVQTIVPILLHAHMTSQQSSMTCELGPFFPKRGQRLLLNSKSNIRPPRPQFQMFLHSNQLEAAKGIDPVYDAAINEYFNPYHSLVDLLLRIAVNQHNINEQGVSLSAAVAYEGVPLHMPYFAKLWSEIYQIDNVDKYIDILCRNSSFIDYVDAVLLDERQTLCHQHIYTFFCNYFPKIHKQVLREHGQPLLDNLLASITAERTTLENVSAVEDIQPIINRILGDIRALMLVYSVQRPSQVPELLSSSLQYISERCKVLQQTHKCLTSAKFTDSVAPPSSPDTAAGAARSKQGHTSRKGRDEEDKDDSCGETPQKRRRKTSSECNNSDSSESQQKQEKDKCAENNDGEKTEPCDDPTPTCSTDTDDKNTAEDSTSITAKKQPGPSSSKSTPIAPNREKPTSLDFVLKSLDMIFNIINKL